MKYLLDTCVISEMIKPKPDKNVISWLEEHNENSLYLSVLTFGEIEKGIEKATNQIRKQKLRLWVEDDLKKRFEGRIIPISFSIAAEWGTMFSTDNLKASEPSMIVSDPADLENRIIEFEKGKIDYAPRNFPSTLLT